MKSSKTLNPASSQIIDGKIELGSETTEIIKSQRFQPISGRSSKRAGKTTFAGKLTNKLVGRKRTSFDDCLCDIYRPAAIRPVEDPWSSRSMFVFSPWYEDPCGSEIVRQGLEQASQSCLDRTAGRPKSMKGYGWQCDVKALAEPNEILLVVDAMSVKKQPMWREFNRAISDQGSLDPR